MSGYLNRKISVLLANLLILLCFDLPSLLHENGIVLDAYMHLSFAIYIIKKAHIASFTPTNYPASYLFYAQHIILCGLNGLREYTAYAKFHHLLMVHITAIFIMTLSSKVYRKTNNIHAIAPLLYVGLSCTIASHISKQGYALLLYYFTILSLIALLYEKRTYLPLFISSLTLCIAHPFSPLLLFLAIINLLCYALLSGSRIKSSLIWTPFAVLSSYLISQIFIGASAWVLRLREIEAYINELVLGSRAGDMLGIISSEVPDEYAVVNMLRFFVILSSLFLSLISSILLMKKGKKESPQRGIAVILLGIIILFLLLAIKPRLCERVYFHLVFLSSIVLPFMFIRPFINRIRSLLKMIFVLYVTGAVCLAPITRCARITYDYMPSADLSMATFICEMSDEITSASVVTGHGAEFRISRALYGFLPDFGSSAGEGFAMYRILPRELCGTKLLQDHEIIIITLYDYLLNYAVLHGQLDMFRSVESFEAELAGEYKYNKVYTNGVGEVFIRAAAA